MTSNKRGDEKKRIQTHSWVWTLMVGYCCGSVTCLRDTNKSACVCLSAVLHGNNLLVFGGTGIPFGENNGNDVHVCNVQYKRWNLLSCRGKKPNKIYGQVAFPPWKCAASFGVTSVECFVPIPGDDHHKRLSVCVWRNNRISVQHRPAQAGPDHQGVVPPEAQ